MFRKIISTIAVASLLAGSGSLLAQERQGRAGRQEAGGAERVQNVQTFRQAFNTWFEAFDKAFEQHDTEKMGLLMEEMKKNKQEWQARNAGRQGGSTWTRRNRPGRGTPASAPGAGAPGLTREEEKKILSVLEDMFQSERRGNMNVPPEDGKVLRLLAEATGAKNIVEIGTSNGYSGIWFCLALKQTGGKLITHDIDEGRAALARKNFERAGVKDMITLVMGDAHETVKKLKDPIDILFIDADKEGYLDYLEKLLPRVRTGGLILAHNMTMRADGIVKYKEAVTTNPDLETLFINREGIGVTLKKR